VSNATGNDVVGILLWNMAFFRTISNYLFKEDHVRLKIPKEQYYGSSKKSAT
jgi:hypothetical protein